ncbi:MAG: hypothetical protein K2P81_15060 [Bacteriovoracaceae bacterium]|nr:hypothetical protein [Bacteriovoracaceae bacterium]
MKTRKILVKLGLEAKLDSKIVKIFKKMDTASLRDKLDSDRDIQILKALDRFDASYNLLMEK